MDKEIDILLKKINMYLALKGKLENLFQIWPNRAMSDKMLSMYSSIKRNTIKVLLKKLREMGYIDIQEYLDGFDDIYIVKLNENGIKHIEEIKSMFYEASGIINKINALEEELKKKMAELEMKESSNN